MIKFRCSFSHPDLAGIILCLPPSVRMKTREELINRSGFLWQGPFEVATGNHHSHLVAWHSKSSFNLGSACLLFGLSFWFQHISSQLEGGIVDWQLETCWSTSWLAPLSHDFLTSSLFGGSWTSGLHCGDGDSVLESLEAEETSKVVWLVWPQQRRLTAVVGSSGSVLVWLG